MRRQIANFSMMVLGVLALMVGFTMVPAPTPAAAGPMLQPSPRPTLQPTPDAVPSDPKPTPVPYGRVTGTVIDQRTGAPASGIPVAIGTDIVFSDGNGNYDLWVVSGYYWMGLQLRADQGVPLQPRQEIAVGVGDTVVVHLFFTSPAPVAPSPEPAAAAPEVAAPSAPLLPTPTAAPAVAVETAPLRNVGAAPATLPMTAGSTQGGSPALWVLLGAVLLSGGGLLQLNVRRARRRVPPMDPQTSVLLGGLLNRNLASRRDEETLQDLLGKDL